MKFAPVEAIDQPPLVEAFLKETWNAIRFSDEAPFVKAWEPPGRSSLYYNMEFVDAPGLATLLNSGACKSMKRFSSETSSPARAFACSAMICCMATSSRRTS